MFTGQIVALDAAFVLTQILLSLQIKPGKNFCCKFEKIVRP